MKNVYIHFSHDYYTISLAYTTLFFSTPLMRKKLKTANASNRCTPQTYSNAQTPHARKMSGLTYEQVVAAIEQADKEHLVLPPGVRTCYECARVLQEIGQFERWQYWDTHAHTIIPHTDDKQLAFWQRQFYHALAIKAIHTQPQEEQVKRLWRVFEASNRAADAMNAAEMAGRITIHHARLLQYNVHMVGDELVYWERVTASLNALLISPLQTTCVGPYTFAAYQPLQQQQPLTRAKPIEDYLV